FGNDHRQSGFLREQFVQVTQKRATAGQYQTTLGNIRGQFRWRLLQCALYRLDDGRQRLLQRLEHFVGVQRERARYAFGKVAPAHIDFTNVGAWERGADFLLDALSGGFTDQAAIVATYIGDDGLIEAITAHSHGLGIYHAIQGNQGDLGGTTANID